MVHFTDIILDEELSLVKNSLANLFGLVISDIISNLLFILQSHEDCLLSELNPVYLQLFSHKDKLFSSNSFCLSFNVISVPLIVV